VPTCMHSIQQRWAESNKHYEHCTLQYSSTSAARVAPGMISRLGNTALHLGGSGSALLEGAQ